MKKKNIFLLLISSLLLTSCNTSNLTDTEVCLIGMAVIVVVIVVIGWIGEGSDDY